MAITILSDYGNGSWRGCVCVCVCAFRGVNKTVKNLSRERDRDFSDCCLDECSRWTIFDGDKKGNK